MADKTCSQCGETMACAAEQDHACWCGDYPAIMPLDPTEGCLCKNCLAVAIGRRIDKMINPSNHQHMLDYAAQYRNGKNLIEYIDYTIETGQYIFSAWYHLKRGSCCSNGCRNCPYQSAG
jgi:hypothetical protein